MPAQPFRTGHDKGWPKGLPSKIPFEVNSNRVLTSYRFCPFCVRIFLGGPKGPWQRRWKGPGAEKHDARVLGLTVSREQAAYARENGRGLDVVIDLKDYRELEGRFDRIVSIPATTEP